MREDLLYGLIQLANELIPLPLADTLPLAQFIQPARIHLRKGNSTLDNLFLSERGCILSTPLGR